MCTEIKCYFFKIKYRKYTFLVWFLLFIWPTISNRSSVITATYRTGAQSHYNVRPLNYVDLL